MILLENDHSFTLLLNKIAYKLEGKSSILSFSEMKWQLPSNSSLPGNEVFTLSVYLKINNFEETIFFGICR